MYVCTSVYFLYIAFSMYIYIYIYIYIHLVDQPNTVWCFVSSSSYAYSRRQTLIQQSRGHMQTKRTRSSRTRQTNIQAVFRICPLLVSASGVKHVTSKNNARAQLGIPKSHVKRKFAQQLEPKVQFKRQANAEMKTERREDMLGTLSIYLDIHIYMYIYMYIYTYH